MAKRPYKNLTDKELKALIRENTKAYKALNKQVAVLDKEFAYMESEKNSRHISAQE